MVFFRVSDTNKLVLNICIQPEFLQQVAQQTGVDGSSLQLIPQFRERNPQIEQIIMMLYGELNQKSGWGSKLYIESLSNALSGYAKLFVS